ncbi:MAG: hypothetical protein DSY42_05300 [Aquifex sp.]|nr:MAG: hypothetical protein DSY42_05300 [Aquifex sp.]
MANNAEDFDAWEDLGEWEELAARPVRRFHHRQDPFQIYSEEEFRRRFRLSKECTQDLLRRIRHHLPEAESERG